MAYSRGLMGSLAAKGSGTWKELGVHYATLNSLVKRGLMEKDGDQYKVSRKGLMLDTIEKLSEGYEFITLRKEGSRLGMLCTLKGCDILDGWDNLWDWGSEDLWFDDYRKSRTQILVKH